MIFQVCEHYDDNQPNIPEHYDQCFICFEYQIDKGTKPINLQRQKLYTNNCYCNVFVHNYCLKIWFNKNKSCPICRISVTEINNTFLIFYNYIPFSIQIYTFCTKIYISFKRIIIEFSNFFTSVLFLYLLLDLYCTIIKNKYFQYTDDIYSYSNFRK